MSRPLQLLLLPLQFAALQVMLLLLGLGSLLWSALALAFYPLLPRPLGRRIGRAAISRGYGLFWWFADLIGMVHLDSSVLDALREERGLIVVANHPTMLDAMMLVARLPRAVCIMKASLMANPLLGPPARLARYIRNDTLAGLLRLAVDDLREGGQLVLFPEGTRTTRSPINPFRPGVSFIAKHAEVPIQAVFIDTESPYLRKGWPLWRLPPLPIRFHVRMGRRFDPRDDHAGLLDELEAYFTAGLKP